LEACVALQHLIFRPDEPEAPIRYRSYVREDPTYRIGQTRIAEVDGRIVGHLRVWDRKLAVRRTVLTAGGIGSLLTHPEYRGRGIASGLLDDTERYFEETGYDIGLLFSIIGTPYYVARGWSPIPISTFELNLSGSKGEETSSARALVPEKDLNAVRRLHKAVSGQYTGTEIRDEAYWLSGPARYRSVFPGVGVDCDGALSGYVNWDVVNGKVWVVECCADGERDYAQLASRVVAAGLEQGTGTVMGSLPQDHPLVDQLEKLGDTKAVWSSHDEMMVKISRLDQLKTKLGLSGVVDDFPSDLPETDAFWRALFGCEGVDSEWRKRLGACPPGFYWWTDIF